VRPESDGPRARDARTLFFTSPGKTEFRTVPLEPKPGDVLVRSRLQGISAGTELLFYRGSFSSDLGGDLPGLPERFAYPIAYGYSNVGVDEAGRRVFGFAPHQDLFLAREADLIALPDDVRDEDAVFLPNLETALGIVQDLHPRFGECVAVVGLGVVGLLVAEILSRSGVGRLVLADVKEGRREAAERLGAIFVNPARESFADRVRDISGGRGLDRAVNVSASGEALGALIDAMGMEGVIVEASWYGTERVSLGLGGVFHRKRLDIRSSQVSRVGGALGPRWDKERRMKLVLALLPQIRPAKYVSHVFPFLRAPEAYALLSENAEEALQVALSCDGPSD